MAEPQAKIKWGEESHQAGDIQGVGR